MKIIDYLNDKIIEKYVSVSNSIYLLNSRWEDFVCDFFNWDSYYLSKDYEKYLKDVNSQKGIEEIFSDKIRDTFEFIFDSSGLRLVNKNSTLFNPSDLSH